MQKWEYMFWHAAADESPADPSEGWEMLNECGGEGWEMVSVVADTTNLGDYLFIFKRPREE